MVVECRLVDVDYSKFDCSLVIDNKYENKELSNPPRKLDSNDWYTLSGVLIREKFLYAIIVN